MIFMESNNILINFHRFNIEKIFIFMLNFFKDNPMSSEDG